MSVYCVYEFKSNLKGEHMTHPKSDISAPWHMWVLGVLLLLWNGLATFDYIMTVMRFEPYLANYPEDALAYFYNAPLWMYLIWGLSMIGGLVGTILLLMRRRAAVRVYAIAWLCSVIAVVYSAVNPVPGGGNILFAAAIIIAALLILFYFYWMQRRGILR